MNVILTTLAATVFIQLGYFLWKLSADKHNEANSKGQAEPKSALRHHLRDWRWVSGLLATSLGWVFFVKATAIGEISLIQPLMSAGDLLLVFLAVIVLKERLRPLEWFGVLIIVLGAGLLSWNTQGTGNSEMETQRLWIFVGAQIALASCLLLALKTGRVPELPLACLVGLAFGAGAILTKALTAASPELSLRLLLDPLLLAVIAANVLGLVSLQIAFHRGRASVIVPVQLAIASGVAAMAGAWVFHEQISSLRVMGIAAIVLGTSLLKAEKQSE